MKQPPDILGATGLKFFGEISASISHELKNILSIINESAGLLDDLTLMAQKDVPIDPQRIQTTAKRVQKQVQRADQIIKYMNGFSHSVDRDLDTLDVHDFMTSLLILTRRITDMRGVRIELMPKEAAITLTTSPFFLKTLLWHLMNFAMGKLGERKTLAISIKKTLHSVELYMTQLDKLQTAQVDGFPSETDAALIDSLGGEISLSDGSIMLSLPQGEPC